MQSVIMFLAFFCFCLEVHHVCCIICLDEQYTIVSSNGSAMYCFNCAQCHPGQGLSPPCGSHVKNEEMSKIYCKDCPSGMFSDEYDPSPCKTCQQCALHEMASANCTKVSDASCNRTCAKGYFFVEVSHSCQQCSFCCFDKNDEPQPECIKQGFKATGQYCSFRSDKNCAPVHPATGTTLRTIVTSMMHYQNRSAPSATSAVVPGDNTKGSTQNNTIIIVLGVLAFMFAFAALIVGFLNWRKRRKEKRRMAGINDRNPCTTLQDDTSCAKKRPTVSDSSTVVPLASPKVKSLQINAGYAPSSPEESPCPTDDELGELRNPKDELRRKRILKRQSSKEAQASKDSASKSLLGSGVEEGSDESKAQEKNGVSPAMDRRPSVVETAIRKLSREISYQPLPGEDPDEPDGNAQKGAIRSSEPIVSFIKRKFSGASTPKKETVQAEVLPRHQEQKEGSRVEFKCNISEETEARYQWFKDDVIILGQRGSSLVLDPVKEEDFGNYKCEVKYDDADSVKCVTSLPAELDIVPRKGRKRKCLRDVDLNIQEMVGNLLTQKKGGPRTWKQLAIKYTMQKDVIISLENSQETAGNEVIAFLARTCPSLTVYEICKELRGKDIQRLDIVEVLLPHLSAPISGGNVRV